jgi:hypothetical protein
MMAKPMMKETTEFRWRRGWDGEEVEVGEMIDEVGVDVKLVDKAVASISETVETIEELEPGVELVELAVPVSITN